MSEPVELLEESEPAVEVGHDVTAVELFFDLVFVFAITQVTGFLFDEGTWLALLETCAILMVLWFAWSAFAWLGNTASADEGPVRVILLVSTGPLLVLSLAVPHAFGADALIFGIAYFAVRVLHLVAYAIVARGDRALQGVVLRLARTILPASALLVLAGVWPGTGRTLCWIAALSIDYGGLFLGGTRDWRVGPAHFAERHRLIVIIALGESIVALGVGAGGLALTASLLAGVLLGMAVAVALWWAYFDVVALVAERRLHGAGPGERGRIARDSYTYLHLPMVAGIVIFADGVKATIASSDTDLHGVAATALCGGVALYFIALSAFKRRNVGSFNVPRLVAASVLAALVPVATAVPALLSLFLVAVVASTLVLFEVFRYAEARSRIRYRSPERA